MGDLFLKTINLNGDPANGGTGRWDLPRNGQPGAWREVRGTLAPCRNGIHVLNARHALAWMGPVFYLIEVEGEGVEHGDLFGLGEPDKYVYPRGRLVEKLTYRPRQLAADVAEHFIADRAPRDRHLSDAVEILRQAEGKNVLHARDILTRADAAAARSKHPKSRAVVQAAAQPVISWKAAKAALAAARSGASDKAAEIDFQANTLCELLGVEFV